MLKKSLIIPRGRSCHSLGSGQQIADGIRNSSQDSSFLPKVFTLPDTGLSPLLWQDSPLI